MELSGLWVAGLIWAVFMGLAAGNFATNPIYRLPRNDKLFGRTPYCGDCNAELQPRDLFPILSWLMTKGRCRYCGAAVPAQYLWVELLITLWFAALYIQHGFGETFLLLALAGVAVVMLFAMDMIDRFFSVKTWVAFMVIGMLYRALEDHSIFPMLMGAFYSALPACANWKIRNPKAHVSSGLPAYICLFAAAGVWFGVHDWIVCMLIWAVGTVLVHICSQTQKFPITFVFGIAWMCTVVIAKNPSAIAIPALW